MVRLRVQSCGETFRIITAEVKRALQKRRNFDGVVVITRLGNASHGGLTINENADPSVRVDLKAALQELTSECKVKQSFENLFLSSIFGQSMIIPVEFGNLVLGTWQGIYLATFDNSVSYHDLHVNCIPATHIERLTFEAPSRGCHTITKIKSPGGILAVATLHTSASIGIVRSHQRDRLEDAFNRVVPVAWHHNFFTHTFEGEDDMCGHVKSSLFGASTIIPSHLLEHGNDSYSIVLNEHRDVGGWGGGHRRKIVYAQLDSISQNICTVAVSMKTAAANQFSSAS